MMNKSSIFISAFSNYLLPELSTVISLTLILETDMVNRGIFINAQSLTRLRLWLIIQNDQFDRNHNNTSSFEALLGAPYGIRTFSFG